MDFIFADFLRKHKEHDAWWYKIKIRPKAPSIPTKDSMLPIVECPGEHSLSQLLGIPMHSLWHVLICCKLAKKTKGIKGTNLLDRKAFAQFIITHGLGNMVVLDEKDKQPVLRVGIYTQNTTHKDHSATNQWKSSKKPPRPLRGAATAFQGAVEAFFLLQKEKAGLGAKEGSRSEHFVAEKVQSNLPAAGGGEDDDDFLSSPEDPQMKSVKDFLSCILSAPYAVNNREFFRADISSEMMHKMFVQTCEVERKNKEAADEKKQKAVSDATNVNKITEKVDANGYPALTSKNICLRTDKDITAVLRDIIKLSKNVKSVDILKVLNYNDSTTSLVEVPCSAKQSGFKQQARRSRWVHRILRCVRKYSKQELVVGEDVDVEMVDEEGEDEDEEYAYKDDDAARWLLTYLGESFPSEFVKSAQALHMPIHQGKMDAEYTAAMWSDAGVGVAAQRIIMKYFLDFFGYKFTVPEGSIKQLVIDSVQPIAGTVEYMDRALDYWYKDLDVLLTKQIAREHINQPGFSYTSVDIVVGADHGQGSFRAGVKVIFRNADDSVQATAIYGLGEIECVKDTSELLALAFTPKLNSALKRMISYERDGNGKIVNDGALAVYKKNIVDGMAEQEERDASMFYANLDRTGRASEEDTLELNVPIRVFITGDLAFYATIMGKEGMDKAHCHWCKLRSSEWQALGHAPGIKWTLRELTRVAASLNDERTTENGVKSYPQLDCIELERFIFPVLHVTLGLANRLLKDTVDYADLVVEKTPQVLKDARHKQIEAAHQHEQIKQEIVDWGIRNGPTLANMHLAQGHLDEQIQVEGELSVQEHEQAILDAASLKLEVTAFKKELSTLKKHKTDLSQSNTAAKLEVTLVEKATGRYSKPVRKGIETILSKEWNIKRPTWHGGDILGNECRKLMAWARLIFEQLKEYLVEQLEEDGGSERAKTEVRKRCDIVAKALLLFDGFLSILRTDHKDLTPQHITKARRYARKALEVWRILELSVTPKCHGSEDHACDQLEFLKGLADFCEDWVEQLHQLGLKNNRRTRTIRNRDRKYKLYTQWEQLSGNRNVQRIKREVNESRKRNLQHNRSAETASRLLVEKNYHREAALEQDNSQWTGQNRLLSPQDIIRLDAVDRLHDSTNG
jgi:hypothetical protein